MGAISDERARRLRVLLVDDHDDTREGYAVYLKFAGLLVDTATDGSEAIRKARALQPDVIVMDLNMPHVDGWQAVRLLRARRETRSIPVLALSAEIVDGHEEARARAAGFDAFCPKPCLPSKLLDLMHDVICWRDPDEPASRDRTSDESLGTAYWRVPAAR
jgi:two-component system cell cycle response regulator DivK